MTKPANILSFKTTAEGAEEFAAILLRIAEIVRDETGTETWFTARAEDDPTRFFIADTFTDADGRQAHFTGAGADLILGEGRALLAGPPEIHSLELLARKD